MFKFLEGWSWLRPPTRIVFKQTNVPRLIIIPGLIFDATTVNDTALLEQRIQSRVKYLSSCEYSPPTARHKLVYFAFTYDNDWVSMAIKTLPSNFVQFAPWLTSLELPNMGLIELPHAIGEFVHLTEFDVSCNELSALPPSMIQLRSLHTLDLRCNPLPNSILLNHERNVFVPSHSLAVTQALLELIGQEFSYRGVRDAIYTTLLCCGRLYGLPKDIVRWCIAPLLWQSRGDPAWTEANRLGYLRWL